MSSPHSVTKEFTIDGVKFKRYTNQDSHGSKTTHCYVDDVYMNYGAYMNRVKKAVKNSGALDEILVATGSMNHYNPDWK
jgi:hypothetical protein